MKKEIEYDLSLTDNMTVRQVENMYLDVRKNGIDPNDPDVKLKASAVQMWKTIYKLRFTGDATNMTIGKLKEWASVVRSAFICIHRVNYTAHSTMSEFYDWYEEKRNPSTNVKKFWKKADEEYRRYQVCIRTIQDASSFDVLDNHLRLVDNEVQIALGGMESTISNVFIHQRYGRVLGGQIDDIELLSKASVSLLWCRVVHHSFIHFFKDYIQKCGIDFTYDFRYADLTGMCRNFCWMLNQMGIKLHDDKNGDKVLDFFDIDKSIVIEAAWSKVMKVVRDEDLADRLALQAIKLNPEANEKFEARKEKEDNEKVLEGIEKLKEKYNSVSK